MIKRYIHNKALELGFSHCGFSRCEPLENLRSFYILYIQENRFASLDYLKRYAEKRLNPEMLVPGARTVIALLMNYYPWDIIPETDNFLVSKYAYGNDYHVLMRKRMDDLIGFMKLTFSDNRFIAFVDSGTVLEKAWAQRCGLGWQGKNTLILNKSKGSFFFIGIILTDLELEPDHPETDHCGDCNKCVSACPTGALNIPYQLNMPRCISYQTVENKSDIPGDLKEKMKDWIYGCDICQDVCPYNRFARPHSIPAWMPSETMASMRKKDWIALTEPGFDNLFAGSAVKRLGYKRLMRNILR